MYIPNVLVILPCLVSFGLCALRYYQANPDNRLTDRRFVVSSGAVATIFAFLLSRVIWPAEHWLPAAFLLLALCLLGIAVWLYRQPLHPPVIPVQTATRG